MKVEIIEGRQERLVLRLFDSEPVAGTHYELLRATSESADSILIVEIDEELAEGFREGLDFIDEDLEVDTTYLYQLTARFEGVTYASAPVEVQWRQPPPVAQSLGAWAAQNVVELRWEPTESQALVFRRDVLQDGPFLRTALVGAGLGVFVDTRVQPGGVYSYRIALAERRGDLIHYGQVSEEFYAGTLDEGHCP